MRNCLEPKEIFITESASKPLARVWYYRMDHEPLVKKIIKFPINYAEIEVRRFLRNSGITYPITLWPAFIKEPPIVHKNITEEIELLDEETKWPEINEVYEKIPEHDIQNWFIRFTKGDKFGMNYNAKQRGHFDPVGIYAYPLDWFYNKMKGSYYATDRPAAYVFRVDLKAPGVYYANSIPENLLNTLEANLIRYGKAINNRYFEQEINRWADYSWDVKTNWFKQFTAACQITKNIITQGYLTKLLLNTGIEAIYDNGNSIINSAEPYQMLVLNPKLCTNLTTVILKQSIADIPYTLKQYEVDRKVEILIKGILSNKIDLYKMNPENILLLCTYLYYSTNKGPVIQAIYRYIITVKKAPDGLLDRLDIISTTSLLRMLLEKIVFGDNFTVEDYIKSGLIEQDDGDYMWGILDVFRTDGKLDDLSPERKAEFQRLRYKLQSR